jgi:hypothetical protein
MIHGTKYAAFVEVVTFLLAGLQTNQHHSDGKEGDSFVEKTSHTYDGANIQKH